MCQPLFLWQYERLSRLDFLLRSSHRRLLHFNLYKCLLCLRPWLLLRHEELVPDVEILRAIDVHLLRLLRPLIVALVELFP